MKIVQLITELQPAGAERIVVNLSKGFNEMGHNVTVISLKEIPEDNHLVQELERSNIEVLSLNLKKLQPWKMFGIRKIIKRINPDILHAHLIHANLVSRITNIGAKYFLINTVHIAEKRPGKWWHFFLDRISSRRCHRQTVVSFAVRDFHAKKIGVDPRKMPVIYNGIISPAKISSTRRQELFRQWKIEDCNKVIGSVGRLEFQKGYDLFLKVLPQLSSKIPEEERWAVVILGEGLERRLLENLAMSIPDNLKVRFPGYRKDAAECIGAMDLFIMPSRYEGFGLTLVEAMAHGVPILASNVDSLPELIKGYPPGKVIDFDGKNESNVIEAIMGNMGYPERIPIMNFTVAKMVEGYSELYKKFCPM